MLRIFFVTLFVTLIATMLVACGGEAGNETPTTSQSDNGLNPTALTLESPPANGKLPVELLPPT